MKVSCGARWLVAPCRPVLWAKIKVIFQCESGRGKLQAVVPLQQARAVTSHSLPHHHTRCCTVQASKLLSLLRHHTKYVLEVLAGLVGREGGREGGGGCSSATIVR